MPRRVGANVKSAELVAERRDAIIRAAIEVFLEKGFHGCSSRDIAEKAGMTQGNLYNYVRSKEDILYLVCDQAVGHYSAGVEEVIASTPDLRERLVKTITTTVETMYERRRNILIVYRESHSLEKASRAAILERADSFVSIIKGVIADAAAAGIVKVEDVDLAAATVTYIPTIFALRAWRLKGASKEAALGYITNSILRGLGVDPA